MTGPTQPSRHEVYAELAAGWALHALEPDDEADFAAHMATCSRCAADVDCYLVLLADIAEAMPADEPPASLGARIRAAVHNYLELPGRPGPAQTSPVALASTPEPSESPAPAGVDTRGGAVVRLDDRRPRRLLLVAAAVTTVLAVGGTVAVSFDQVRTAGDRAEQIAAQLSRRDAEVARLRAVAEKRAEVLRLSAQPGVSLTVLAGESEVKGYVIVRNGNAKVIADGLGPNDVRSTTYVLWLLPRGGGVPLPLESFDVAGAFSSTAGGARLPSAVAAGGFAVSLEPGRRMPSKPTTVVANGEVES
ncbi:MAG TPA: anti-sigma factor [Cryptosporangiaceae bacterium]|nr:anti-sigma factor [Cryptosporangiaceae bacterium]